ncbi:hypothetical protein T492DRAFT_998809 [Pavlovales sp. CCMP2436]|nr:hypothetical protein T492DRAFT_998809 [Pavlovales sp. CCMP2436]
MGSPSGSQPRSEGIPLGSPMNGIDIHAIISELSTEDQFWLDLPHVQAAGAAQHAEAAAAQQRAGAGDALHAPLQAQAHMQSQQQPEPLMVDLYPPQPGQKLGMHFQHSLAAAQPRGEQGALSRPAAGTAGGDVKAEGENDLRSVFACDLTDKVPFRWERSSARLRCAFCAEEQAPLDDSDMSPLTMRVMCDKSLLYSEKKRQWTWHKKWTLPRFSVELLSEGALLTSSGLTVHVTAVVFNEDRLDEVGLSGTTSVLCVGGNCSFQSLFFKSTSFNNKGASFHLLIGVVHSPDLPDAPRKLLGCWTSSPIHVDARKRQLSESAGGAGARARADDEPPLAAAGLPSGAWPALGALQPPYGAALGADMLLGAHGRAPPGPFAGPLAQAPACDFKGVFAQPEGDARATAAQGHAAAGAGFPAPVWAAMGAGLPRPPASDTAKLAPAVPLPAAAFTLAFLPGTGAEQQVEGRDCDECTDLHAREQARWHQLLCFAHESLLQLEWRAASAQPADPRPAQLIVCEVLTSGAHGFSREELRGSDFMQMVHPSERVLLKGVLLELGGEHTAVRMQMRVLSQAGNAVTVDALLSIERKASARTGQQLLLLSTRSTPSWHASGGFHVEFVEPGIG